MVVLYLVLFAKIIIMKEGGNFLEGQLLNKKFAVILRGVKKDKALIKK